MGEGVCVTVCVTAAPETVVTRTVVTGEGDAGELVGTSELGAIELEVISSDDEDGICSKA